MGQECIRNLQHRHLVDGFKDPDIVRQILEMLRVRAHGDDHLPVCPAKRADAVAVEFPVLIDGSHGNVDCFLRGLFHGLRDRPDGRTDEMIPVREGLRTGLVVCGGVDDGIRFVVVLYDIQNVFDRIAALLQPLQLSVDARHGQQHLPDFPCPVFHVLG